MAFYSKPLWSPEEGICFNNQTEAARHYGVDPSSISKHIRGLQHTIKGFVLEPITVEEALELGLDVADYRVPPRAVRCINDGREFPSIRAAAKHYKLDPGSVAKQVRGKSKSVGGYSFEAFQKG